MVNRPVVVSAVLVSAMALLGCGVDGGSVRVTQLPADLARPVAASALQTRDGQVYVSLLDGAWLRLTADGAAWEAALPPAVRSLVADHQQGQTLGLGTDGTWLRAGAAGFAALEPGVPSLPATFAGNRSVLGRDARGSMWAIGQAVGSTAFGDLALHRLDPDAGTTWQLERFPIHIGRHIFPATSPAMTSEGRFFYRPLESGLWEVDRAGRALVERVPCTHPLFRASHPDYLDCQEDTVVFAGRHGQLLLLNPNHELWRLAPGSSTPALVVKGALPQLVLTDEAGFNFYSPGGYRVYVDPQDRVWLLFRWGDNDPGDTSYLYVADPARGDGWSFVRSDLPRNLLIFGDGPGPLLTGGSPEDHLLVFRVEG
jgi:hypothetical protein